MNKKHHSGSVPSPDTKTRCLDVCNMSQRAPNKSFIVGCDMVLFGASGCTHTMRNANKNRARKAVKENSSGAAGQP